MVEYPLDYIQDDITTSKVAVIGKGRWGKRLAEKKYYINDEIFSVDDIYSLRKGGDLTKYNKIIVAVPSIYLDKLENFKVSSDVIVFSATKGLYKTGITPSDFINKLWNVSTYVIGGPNIKGKEHVFIGGCELELAGILKNVYAIGYAKIKDINEKSIFMAECVEEMINIVGEYEFLADLFATANSNESRNVKYAKTGKAPKGQVVEGYYTAKIIEEYDLFPNLEKLRKVCKEIE